MIWFVLAVVACLCSCRPYHTNLKIYLNKTQIDSQVNQILRNTPWIKKGQCHNAANIEYLQVRHTNNTPRALIVCGIHARQLITVDTCLNFLKTFIVSEQLYKKWQLDMFLVANDQRYSVLQGLTCIRTDKQGVDLNRNYDVDFYQGESDPHSQTYRGLYPLSQPLSKCVDRLLRSSNYTAVIDIHSGSYALYHQTDKNRTIHRKNARILSQVKRRHCKPCLMSTLKQADDTYVGHLFAYAAQHFNVPYPMLFQIFSSHIHPKFLDNHDIGCFKQFNPESEKFRQYILNQWTNILSDTLVLIHQDAIK